MRDRKQPAGGLNTVFVTSFGGMSGCRDGTLAKHLLYSLGVECSSPQ